MQIANSKCYLCNHFNFVWAIIKHIFPLYILPLCRYIYSGTVSIEELKKNDISALLLAIDELQLSALLEYTQDELITDHKDYLEQHLVEIFHTTANIASCKVLHNHCQQAISARPELLFNADDFTKLDHEAFKSLLQQDNLKMDEIDIWKKLISWGVAHTAELTAHLHTWSHGDFQKLGETIKDLVPLVHFVAITANEFYHHVMPYKKALSKNLYKEVLQYHLDSTYKPERGNLLPARCFNPSVASVLLNTQQSEWVYQHIQKNSGQQPQQQYQLKLLYRGSQDGFGIADFHRLCDNKGSTLTVIHPTGENQQLLGGYTALDWKSSGGWKADSEAFIFSFNSKTVDGAIYSSIIPGSDYAMCCGIEHGPIFGDGNDLAIGGWGMHNFTDAGSCGCIKRKWYSSSISSLQRFHIDEIEVFQVLKV